MPTNADFWTERVVETLKRYDEPLVRRVCENLCKPRNQWPTDVLIERAADATANAAVIDRRLQALEPAGRKLLAVIGHSRQPWWKLGSLLEILTALEENTDVRPVVELIEAGLLYPDLCAPSPSQLPSAGESKVKGRLRSIEQWLGTAGDPAVFAHPHVTARTLGEDLGLPECLGLTVATGAVHEADGLEWPLRVAAVWQQVAECPLRRTQHGEFFKRDLDRLRQDPVLNAAPADHLIEMPDAALLAVELAVLHGQLREADGELTAAEPPAWNHGLPALLESLWATRPQLIAPADPGSRERSGSAPSRRPAANPYASAQLLALLILSRLPPDGWADPEHVERWIVEHHPYWSGGKEIRSKGDQDSRKPEDAKRSSEMNGSVSARPSVSAYLLGFAYQLRLLQAAKAKKGTWVVRLSPLGRWLLGFAEQPAPSPAYPQTLLVQPNLEIVAYRQGLTTGLIARLSQFATWKSLGAACTLQLKPETVYRALETGQSFGSIRQTLEQHSMRELPTAVVESLRTWANKRERLGVYPSATLFEFASADELNEALARGLPGTRLTDRLAVVVDEKGVDFRHFRLTGTRDYGLPPDKCIEVADDGVTLHVDVSKSDLLLETELQRFAEPADRVAPRSTVRAAGFRPAGQTAGGREYRLTPASLAAVRDNGLNLQILEDWFLQRTGQPLSPAARLLLTGSRLPTPELRRQLVLHVTNAEIADGLMQWPQTRLLIEARLGPAALAVAEENVEELRRRLAALGISLQT